MRSGRAGKLGKSAGATSSKINDKVTLSPAGTTSRSSVAVTLGTPSPVAQEQARSAHANHTRLASGPTEPNSRQGLLNRRSPPPPEQRSDARLASAPPEFDSPFLPGLCRKLAIINSLSLAECCPFSFPYASAETVRNSRLFEKTTSKNHPTRADSFAEENPRLVRISDFSGVDARSAGFIPQERAREAGRRQYLAPPCSRSSLRTQVRAPLLLREEPRQLGGIFSLRVAGRDADGPSPPEKSEMRTPGSACGKKVCRPVALE